jgi:hypothetical protein
LGPPVDTLAVALQLVACTGEGCRKRVTRKHARAVAEAIVGGFALARSAVSIGVII